MKTLSAADFRIALDDLFTAPERFDIFKTTAAYIVYGADLNGLRAELPLTLKGNRPMAKDLSSADMTHDWIGGALLDLTVAIQEHPYISQALKEKAGRVQAQFIPNRAVLRAKYKKEVQTAKANREKLAEMEADLKSIPTPDARTAYDWVVEFLDSGDTLGDLLNKRSQVEAGEPGPELMLARSKALALVTKARDLVADEAEKTSKLPKNAEAILFGYFDTLSAFRTAAKNDEEEPPPPPVAEPPVASTPAAEPK